MVFLHISLNEVLFIIRFNFFFGKIFIFSSVRMESFHKVNMSNSRYSLLVSWASGRDARESTCSPWILCLYYKNKTFWFFIITVQFSTWKCTLPLLQKFCGHPWLVITWCTSRLSEFRNCIRIRFHNWLPVFCIREWSIVGHLFSMLSSITPTIHAC